MEEKLYKSDKKIEDTKNKIYGFITLTIFSIFFMKDINQNYKWILGLTFTIGFFGLLYNAFHLKINREKWENQAKKEKADKLNNSIKKENNNDNNNLLLKENNLLLKEILNELKYNRK